jgi:SAM-dependent methyltransferase
MTNNKKKAKSNLQNSAVRKSVSYWDKLAAYGPKASVIDPNDKRGHKNEYISSTRDMAILNSLSGLHDKALVLDFGCGSGNLSHVLLKRGFMVLGIDISRKLLQYAESATGKKPSLFLQYDGKSIPVLDNTIDGIVVYGVFCYILDESEFISILQDLYRSLKPGSEIIAIEQVRKIRKYSNDGMQVRRTAREVIDAFNMAGYEYQKHQIIRRGHFPMIYLIRYGLIPRFLYKLLAKIETLLGRIFRTARFDYAETLFVFKKTD